MKIKDLNDAATVWPFFYDYSVRSKPYSGCESPSAILRKEKIKGFFEDLGHSCEIYRAEEDGEPFGFMFTKVEKDFMYLSFAFGISSSSKFSHTKWTECIYRLFDLLLEKYKKNYFVAEIRREHKVEAFKKWIEKYQKKAILFKDPKNTIVWCKSERMSVIFKVVGTNKTTEHLMGKEASLGYTRKGPRCVVRELLFEDQRYILDEKSIDFLSDHVLIHGLLSDDKENVGRIALKFEPQKIK
mgnify:CR=1 FL=1|tara:strand:- start:356 stop:1081 length:726 start_codon:yes stop_codon:yes gene_type:complete